MTDIETISWQAFVRTMLEDYQSPEDFVEKLLNDGSMDELELEKAVEDSLIRLGLIRYEVR